MKFLTHKKFDKAFKKLNLRLQNKVFEQLKIFEQNSRDVRLNNHPLIGKFLGYKSINLSGDIRIIYEQLDLETIKLVNVGTHSQLYG